MSALLSLLLVADPFPNWESAPVHSVALTDAGEVLVCNVAQATLEIFSATTPPVWLDAVSVGLDPVSVRVRPGSREAWVVNHVSDSVSVIDLDRRVITAVLPVLDEPGDVVFAGSPERAYVSCSTDECLLVFDPSNLDTVGPNRSSGEEPNIGGGSQRAICVRRVLVFGQRTTVLAGGGFQRKYTSQCCLRCRDTVRGSILHNGATAMPPRPAGQPTPPRVGLIVRGLSDAGLMTTGPIGLTLSVALGSEAVGPRVGMFWTTISRWSTPSTTTRFLMSGRLSVVTGVAVHPNSGDPVAIGIESFNEIRFEPCSKASSPRFVSRDGDRKRRL